MSGFPPIATARIAACSCLLKNAVRQPAAGTNASRAIPGLGRQGHRFGGLLGLTGAGPRSVGRTVVAFSAAEAIAIPTLKDLDARLTPALDKAALAMPAHQALAGRALRDFDLRLHRRLFGSSLAD
jgi:hypothetical protein